MSRFRRLAHCVGVLVTGCTSTVLVMSLVDPALSALTVRIGYLSGLVVSVVLAAGLLLVETLHSRRRRADRAASVVATGQTRRRSRAHVVSGAFRSRQRVRAAGGERRRGHAAPDQRSVRQARRVWKAVMSTYGTASPRINANTSTSAERSVWLNAIPAQTTQARARRWRTSSTPHRRPGHQPRAAPGYLRGGIREVPRPRRGGSRG